MVIIIKWSDEAKKTFDDNIQYLAEEWGEREVRNFINTTNSKIQNIELNPKLYQLSYKNPSIRRCGINKSITLFYKYFPVKKEVILLTFWNNRKNPKKLKY